MTQPIAKTRLLATLLLGVALILAWSGWQPYDRVTWLLEVFPVLIIAPILVATYQRFPLTTVMYCCIAAHAVVLLVGGAYTYARVPLGFEMQELFHLSRNPYDKIGHFMQGFVPALASREILLRGGYVKRGKMLNFLVICVVLAISACYELIEWWSALALGQGADEFLGTQGDAWDTQSDMMFAGIGAIVALITLAKLQDKQIKPLS